MFNDYITKHKTVATFTLFLLEFCSHVKSKPLKVNTVNQVQVMWLYFPAWSKDSCAALQHDVHLNLKWVNLLYLLHILQQDNL